MDPTASPHPPGQPSATTDKEDEFTVKPTCANDNESSDDSDYKPDSDLSEDEQEIDERNVEQEQTNIEAPEAVAKRRGEVDEIWKAMKQSATSTVDKQSAETDKRIAGLDATTTADPMSAGVAPQSESAPSASHAQPKDSTTAPTVPAKRTAAGPPARRRRQGGVEALAASYLGTSETAKQVREKKQRPLNTLEKSKADWSQFVDREGIRDDLTYANKDGYLDKQDFLGRSADRSAAGIKALRKQPPR